MDAPMREPIATRLYTGLLRLYPRAHRQEYGPLMAQLFRDQCREIYARRRPWGMLWLWLRTLWDLCVTVVQEHLHLAAGLGMANQPVTPLPWRQVLLALLPGLGVLFTRTGLFAWLVNSPATPWGAPMNIAHNSPLYILYRWLHDSWLYLACGLLLWSWWRERRLARWVYPVAGLAIYALPLSAGLFFQGDGSRPSSLSLFLSTVISWLIPLTWLVISATILWTRRRRIRCSFLTWIALGLLFLFRPFMGLIAGAVILLPATLGLLAAPRDRLYAALFVLGTAWGYADGFLDPSYAIGIWTDAYPGIICLIGCLPTFSFLILPVIWVLRARTTHQQLAGLVVFPFVGLALAELARFLALYHTEYSLHTMENLQWKLSDPVQMAAVMALVGLTFAQFAPSSNADDGAVTVAPPAE
ncbi:MAG: hypothetical protein JXA21_01070 [Anaerolineae bacterium]|nr:hypothetical protein [Anaerolineae bacterium]